MKEELVTDAEIRQFLLGSVDDSERQRIEGLFMSDAKFNERVVIAEEDLVEDYLEDSLALGERDKFLSQYGDTPTHQRNLRITRAIKDHAASAGRVSETVPASANRVVLSSRAKQRNLRFFIPVAAVLTIALIFGVVWWLRSYNQRKTIERELAELNARPDFSINPSQVDSLGLRPVSTRGVGTENKLTPRNEIHVVELNLLWTQKKQYPTYSVLVRRVGANEEFRVSGLHIEAGGKSIRVKLPSHLLREGLYQVTLTGTGTDGADSQGEEYTFVVGA